MLKVKTVSELKKLHEELHPTSVWFRDETLEEAGEPFSEMFLFKNMAEAADKTGEMHLCYKVGAVNHKAPAAKPVDVDHYFDADTLEWVATHFIWDDDDWY